MITPDDLKSKAEKESKFYIALRGLDPTYLEISTPRVIKFMANELSLLGEHFMKQTIEQQSVVDENDSNFRINAIRNID